MNFDQLVEEVKQMETQAGQIKLWSAAFALDKWLCLAHPEEKTQPLTVVMEDKRWLLFFTDAERLAAYARDLYEGRDYETYFLAMTPDRAVEWLDALQGGDLHGILFNEGPHGWYAPLSNMKPMQNYLRV